MSQCQTWFVPHAGTKIGYLIVQSIIKRKDRVAVPLGTCSDLVCGDDYIMYVDIDVKSKPSCEGAVSSILSQWGSIDVLVTYAAYAMYVEPIETLEDWQLRDQMEISLFSCLNPLHSVLPSMSQQPAGGHIINVLDINGLLATPCLGASSAAMHALEAYCEGLAYDVAPYSVRVSTVQCSLPVSLSATSLYLDKPEGDGAGVSGQTVPPATKKRKSVLNQNMSESLALVTRVDTVSEAELMEPIRAIMEIAGSKNPPLRLVAGITPSSQVRDYLSSLTDDFDDFEQFFEQLGDSTTITEQHGSGSD